MKSQVARWAKKLRQKLIKEFGGKCRQCNSTDRLEFAHIKPTVLNGEGRGLSNRMRDVRDNPKSYALMCRDCHLIFDSLNNG